MPLENGYIRLARNQNNHCGVASGAMYPIIKAEPSKPSEALKPSIQSSSKSEETSKPSELEASTTFETSSQSVATSITPEMLKSSESLQLEPSGTLETSSQSGERLESSGTEVAAPSVTSASVSSAVSELFV